MGIDLGGWALKLFDEVCNLIGGDNAFPPDEPEDARALGQAWREVATLLEGAVGSTNKTGEKIFGEWVDSAGHEYLTMISSFNGDLGGLVTSCKKMADFCEQYARDVHQQRMATRIEMIINAAAFALAFTGGGSVVAGIFARKVAGHVVGRMVAAAARTAVSAQSRSAVRQLGLNLGKEIAIEGLEEGVISAGSQLASQAAGYNPGGINTKQLVTDTLAGSIGGVLGYGPGKLVNGVVKPKGFVGQHLSAAVTGAGLNAVTSPVSSVAAHDLVNGEFSGLDDYGKAIKENAGDAARMGAFRANGTVAAGQFGSASGMHGYTAELAGLDASTGGGPDGPPPDNTLASNEAPGTSSSAGDGSAGQGAGEPGASAGQEGGAGGAGTTGTESTGAGGNEGAGGTTSGKGTAPSSSSPSSGHESTRTSTGDGSPDATAGAETEEGGAGTSNDNARQEGAAGQHSSQESATTDPGAGEQSGAGGTTGDTAGPPAAGDPAAGGAATAGANAAGQAPGPAGQASGTAGQASGTAGQSSNTAGQTASTTGQSGSVTSSSATGPAGGRNAASGKAERAGDPASGMPEAASSETATQDPAATESTKDPAASEATRSAEPQQEANRPAEISPEVWQTLPQPVQDAISRLFARNTTSQAVKNTVTRLAGLNVAEQAKQEITELAGTLQPSVLKALVDIAERAPTALDAAITLAKQNRAVANKTIRKIRDLAGRNATELQAFLDQLGDSGTAADKADEAKARPPRKRQAEPWARFPLPADHGLPKDARTARRRDVERARGADVVRDHLGPGLQRAADEAAATFKSRSPNQRFTGKRAETVDAAEQAAKQATEARQKAQEENADKAVVDELKKRESKAWRNFNITVKRESGSEIHAIFEEIIKRDHNKLLGEYADRYRLRTEAPYNLNGSARHPGAVRPDLVLERMSPNGGVWYTAHTYDLKTGETGITGSWAFRVDRMARGLFEVEEIRPSGSGRPAASEDPTAPDNGPQTNAPTPTGIDDATAALTERKLPVADAVVAGIHALAKKMSPDLLTGYLTNIAETIMRSGAGKSLAEHLSAMTATQLDAFRAQLARLAARPSLPTRFSGAPDHSATPAEAGEVGGAKGFVQEAGDVHAMLDRLAELGVNVDSARKALNDEMRKTDLQVLAESRATKLSQLEGNAQGLMGLFTEVEAALALAEMDPAMLAELGLPGLKITGLRIGKDPDVDIMGRLADGREVRIEVKDHRSFGIDNKKFTEIAGQVARHGDQVGDGGLVISLFTNEVSGAVADALVAKGADMVLRYDGYSFFSVMAERPAATPADPNHTNGEPDGGKPTAPENEGMQRKADPEPGLIAASARQPLLPAQRPVTDARTAQIDAIAQSLLRGADRFAGMSSVVPPAGDSQVHQVTDADGHKFDATVNAADLGGVAAIYHTDEQGIVRITVSSRATPTAVPALVAAALAEAAAALSGRGAGVADFLVKDSSGDPMLSRRDLGRAAQLLANDNLLRHRPLRLQVRSQLKKLIREMGLAPDQDGASSRLAALPDQMREAVQEAVRRHTTELDGLPGTLLHLAKNLSTAIPMSAALAVAAAIAETSPPFIAAMVAASLARAVVQSLYDRSTAVRENAAADEQLTDRKHQLKDRVAAELGGAFLNGLAQLDAAGNEHARTVVGPTGEAKGPTAVTAQLARIYGIPRNATALAALTAIGVVAALGATPVLGALSPIAALFVGTSAVAPALVGPVLDAAKKRYTMELKAARNDALLTRINDLIAGRGHEIAAYANNFVGLVGARLAQEFGDPLTDAPGVKSRKFWFGDNVAAQLALNLVPRTRASNDEDRAADPNDLAAFLHLWGEYVGFRGAHAAATVGMNLAFGAKQHVAEQDASFARKQYDGLREADRDVAAVARALAAILGTTVPEFASPDGNTPLARSQGRPSGLPSSKWLLVGVAAGVLTLGVTVGMHALFGMGSMVPFAVAGVATPVAEAGASRMLSAKELKLGDTKAELDRAEAQDARVKLTEALTEFGQHVQNDTDPAPRQATGTDPVVDRILADRDQAYRDLLNEVRQLLGTPGADLSKLGETIFARLAALSDLAAKAEKLGTVRATLAEHGQVRAEVVTRDQLIAALQKYNKIPGVPTLSIAGLLDGVHNGNADQHPLPDILSDLPALPADVTGQVAAVTRDQHLGNPDVPVEVSADVAAWSGNEGWAVRVANAAGVPSGQFVPATINDIVGRLQQLGAGSRAIVHAKRTAATGVATSGDLLNAVNIGEKVYFLDAVTGEPADVTQYTDGLSMLITNDNGEHARDMAGRPVVAKLRAAAARLGADYQDLVPGSLLTDPAAPGLPGRAEATDLSDGLDRIASVINPDRYLPAVLNPALGNDMPSIHAFSDQWDYEEWPAPEAEKLVAGLGMARATAGLALAMLDNFGGPDATDMVEFKALTDLLAQENIPPTDLFDAMTDLMEALLDDPGAP